MLIGMYTGCWRSNGIVVGECGLQLIDAEILQTTSAADIEIVMG